MSQKQDRSTFKLSLFHLSLFTLLLVQIQTFNIVGHWKITDISQTSIPSIAQPTMNITQFVFRNQSIRYILEIESCGKLKIMLDMSNNAIQIDEKTQQMEILENENIGRNNGSNEYCQFIQSLNINNILQNLKKTFSFQLIYNFMIFSNAKGQITMKFTRIFSPLPNITGSWIINWIQGTGIGEILTMKDNVIRFCGGNVGYKLGNRQINFEQIVINSVSDECHNFDIQNSLKNSKYFVRRNSSLQFYSNSDNLTLSMNIISLANNSETNTNVPIPNSSQNTSQIIIPLDFSSISSLVGKWQVFSVFKVQNMIKTIQFIISPNSIILSGKCSTVILPFIIDIVNPLRINRNTMQIVQGNCVQEDQGIYRTAMGKIKDFKGQIEGEKYVVEVGDGMGEIVFKLERNVEYRTENQIQGANNMKPEQNTNLNNLTIVNSPVIVNVPVVNSSVIVDGALNSSFSIGNGRYVILLLKRRDLVRKIVTVENLKFLIELCNKVDIIIEQKNSKQVIFKYTKQTSKQCSTVDEQIWISYFNLVRKFRKQGSNIYLSADDNSDVITMSFLG